MWTHTASIKVNATLFLHDTMNQAGLSWWLFATASRPQVADVRDDHRLCGTRSQTRTESLERPKKVHIECRLKNMNGHEHLGDKFLIVAHKLILLPTRFIFLFPINRTYTKCKGLVIEESCFQQSDA